MVNNYSATEWPTGHKIIPFPKKLKKGKKESHPLGYLVLFSTFSAF